MGEILVSRRFDCFEEYANLMHKWDIDFRQLSRSSAATRSVLLSIGGMLVRRSYYGCHVDQRGVTPKGMYTFAFLLPHSSSMYWNGIDVEPGSLVLYGNGVLEALTRPGFEVLTYSIPSHLFEEWFDQSASRLFAREAFVRNRIIKLSKEHQEKLVDIYDVAKKTIQESRPYAEETSLVETFLHLIREILNRPMESSMMILTKKRRLLNKFLEYGREHSRANITVGSLSREIGVSTRRIQQLFQDEIGGLTPKSYLRSQRLYSAYRMLRNTPPAAGAVSSIASELEFSNFSKFTQSYHRLFGELPSATLRRPEFPMTGLRVG